MSENSEAPNNTTEFKAPTPAVEQDQADIDKAKEALGRSRAAENMADFIRNAPTEVPEPLQELDKQYGEKAEKTMEADAKAGDQESDPSRKDRLLKMAKTAGIAALLVAGAGAFNAAGTEMPQEVADFIAAGQNGLDILRQAAKYSPALLGAVGLIGGGVGGGVKAAAIGGATGFIGGMSLSMLLANS